MHGPRGSVAASASHPLLVPEPVESPVGELYVFRMRSHSEWEVVCSGFKSTSVSSGVCLLKSLPPVTPLGWPSAGVDFAPRGVFAVSGDIFVWHNLGTGRCIRLVG